MDSFNCLRNSKLNFRSPTIVRIFLVRGNKVLTVRRQVFIYIPKIYEPLSDSESEQELAEHEENAIFSLSEEEDELESF